MILDPSGTMRVLHSRLSRLLPVFMAVGLTAFVLPVARAADALSFEKNYFITGDYVVGGVGLRGTGVNGYAMGTINIGKGNGPNQVPPGADIVAAFLYWETEETAPAPSAINGYFDGNAIVGKNLGSPTNPACLSSAAWGRVYRADVLRYLSVDSTNNVRIAAGNHTVKLPDSGNNANGGGAPLTNGASLVVVYRIVTPGVPLSTRFGAVVIYDGAYTLAKGTAAMSQTIGGFYSAGNAPGYDKITLIAANGQSGFSEQVTVNGLNMGINPFTGKEGTRWDNPTFNLELNRNSESFQTQVTSGGPQVCLTFAAIVTGTSVVDTDHDGLLDVWETKGMHLNTQVSPATFGGCSDYPSDPCVDLPHMGAKPTTPDIFIELDWMHGNNQGDPGGGHLHLPKYGALSVIGAAFAAHGINAHFDVGNNYQGSPYIIPSVYARGGDLIEESSLLCPNSKTSVCAFSEPYAALGWKKGLEAIKNGFPSLGISAHFDHIRKDIFHYVLFAHALAGPFDSTGKALSTNPSSVSGVADRPGGDVMVTLGLWRSDNPAGCDPSTTCTDQTGSVLVQAGTLMHELGHNLDLSHGGLWRTPNCMPNYLSVMNYLYQTRGLTDSGGLEHIDYSTGLLFPINEKILSEKLSLSALPLKYRIRFYGPPTSLDASLGHTAKVHCDGTAVNGGSAVRLESPGLSIPDWNNNLTVSATPFAEDINFDGSIGTGVNGTPFFVDTNDWFSLNLQQISARLNVAGLSADVGQSDLGQSDLGQSDLGQSDLGQSDLGQSDLGQSDLGQSDLGQSDLGDVDYDTVISTLDPTSSDPGSQLAAASKIDGIRLKWGSPSIGQIRSYKIYRTDPAHTTPALLVSVTGVPAPTTYDDVVNDFAHTGSTCAVAATCYNTTYTYFLTAVDVNGTVSGASNTTSGDVMHLFVIGDVSKTLAYNGTDQSSAVSANFHIYGQGTPTPTVTCTTAPAPAHNAVTYPITCSSPQGSQISPTIGVTYDAPYNDGTAHTPGTLTITKLSLTVTAITSAKTYDGTVNSSSTPTLTSGRLASGDTVTWTETYDSRNIGAAYNLTPGGTVNDQNGGNNYTVTFVKVGGGKITPAPLTITALTNTKGYDANVSAAVIPAVTGVPPASGDTVSGLVETYDSANVGSNKTLTVSPSFKVNDGNSGKNYTVTTKTDATGVIHKADATITVTPYTATYDGNPHTAVGTATGIFNESLVGLDLSHTTHTNAAGYSTDYWVFTDPTGNYNSVTTTITDTINQATPTVTVTGNTCTYNSTGCAGTGATMGVLQPPDVLTPVTLSYAGASYGPIPTPPVNAGTYTVTASFPGNNNYKSGTSSAATLIINQATPTVTATGNTCIYSGLPCAGGGSATGILAETLLPAPTLSYSGSPLAPVNAGAYMVIASFAGNINYKPGASSPAALTINKAASTTTVTGGTFPYDGLPHAATVSVMGAGGLNLSPSPAYSGGCSSAPITIAQGTNCTASYTYIGDQNHLGSSGSAAVSITPIDLTALALNGVPNTPTLSGTTLRLSNSGSDATSAWLKTEQSVAAGFSTTFTFQISPTSGTLADGFAFVIQGGSGTTALGTPGRDLGYTGILNSIAVEFDTFRNGEFGDPNGALVEHIGIQSNGTGKNSSNHNLYALAAPVRVRFADGLTHTATITYDRTTLKVFLDSATAPIVSARVALTGSPLLALDNGGTAFVGFTAATGASSENADILSWTWASN